MKVRRPSQTGLLLDNLIDEFIKDPQIHSGYHQILATVVSGSPYFYPLRVKEGGDLDNKDLLLHPKKYYKEDILISRQPCKDCEQNINGSKIVNDCGQCVLKWAGDTCSIQGNTQNILEAAESGNLNRVKKILEEDINNNDSNVFLEKIVVVIQPYT